MGAVCVEEGLRPNESSSWEKICRGRGVSREEARTGANALGQEQTLQVPRPTWEGRGATCRDPERAASPKSNSKASTRAVASVPPRGPGLSQGAVTQGRCVAFCTGDTGSGGGLGPGGAGKARRCL